MSFGKLCTYVVVSEAYLRYFRFLLSRFPKKMMQKCSKYSIRNFSKQYVSLRNVFQPVKSWPPKMFVHQKIWFVHK